MSTLATGHRIGGYAIHDVLGRGGLATVYRGSDMRELTCAALKVVDAADAVDTAARQRIRHEAHMLDATRGDHVPQVLGIDTTGDTPFLAMSVAGTRSLAALLRDEGPLMLAEAREVVLGVADALQRIHDDGILHMDLTPSNVVLGPDGVRVVDFGAAVPMADVGPQHARSYQGTTGYVALERCLGATPNAKMDIFSLGALTYRALTGIRPYADSRSLRATRRLSPKSLKQPLLIRPGIGPYISDLLLRTLALDPSERPASPHEFAGEFAMGMPRTRLR